MSQVVEVDEREISFAPKDEGPQTLPQFRLPFILSFVSHAAIFVLILGSGLSERPPPARESVFVVDLMEDIPARAGGGAPEGSSRMSEANPPAPVKEPEPIPPPPVELPPQPQPKTAKPKPKPVLKLAPGVPQSKPQPENTGVPSPVSSSLDAPGLTGRSSTDRGNGSGSPNGEANQAARTEYSALLLRLLNKHKEYPGLARKRGIEGTVVVKIVLLRDGSLQNFEVVTSSGSDILDDGAKAMVIKATPYPPLSDSIEGAKATFVVPVTFKLN